VEADKEVEAALDITGVEVEEAQVVSTEAEAMVVVRLVDSNTHQRRHQPKVLAAGAAQPTPHRLVA
jgi:hypothetical protein